MDGKRNDLVTYFTNGRMLRSPKDRTVFRDAMPGAEEMADLLAQGVAVINWANVCYTREWQEPEELDP